ncbi:hypothetical protein B0H11DRAFT_1907436 [Mycena galericulata]|nr:hypothetical protein B0H11DRAFT_1907436 [Mycena galericulata]
MPPSAGSRQRPRSDSASSNSNGSATSRASKLISKAKGSAAAAKKTISKAVNFLTPKKVDYPAALLENPREQGTAMWRGDGAGLLSVTLLHVTGDWHITFGGGLQIDPKQPQIAQGFGPKDGRIYSVARPIRSTLGMAGLPTTKAARDCHASTSVLPLPGYRVPCRGDASVRTPAMESSSSSELRARLAIIEEEEDALKEKLTSGKNHMSG